MSSADGPFEADPQSPVEAPHDPGKIQFVLVEALIHVLMEKGVLTRNDALSVVETSAQVVRGMVSEGREAGAQTRVALQMLKRMYASFEAVSGQPGVVAVDGVNVRHLRPPLHGDRPKFPRDD